MKYSKIVCDDGLHKLGMYLTPVNSTLLLGQLYVYECYLNNAIKIIYAKVTLGP